MTAPLRRRADENCPSLAVFIAAVCLKNQLPLFRACRGGYFVVKLILTNTALSCYNKLTNYRQ